MNFGEGLKKVSIVAYTIVTVNVVGWMALYSSGPDGWEGSGMLALMALIGFGMPVFPQKEGSIISHLEWNGRPLGAFCLTMTYLFVASMFYFAAITDFLRGVSFNMLLWMVLAFVPMVVTVTLWVPIRFMTKGFTTKRT